MVNSGTLTLVNSTVSNNSSTFPAFNGGGGLVNFGTARITGSTFSGNSAQESGGGVDNAGQLLIANSTITGNSAMGPAPTGGGGGLFSGAGSTAVIISVTITANAAIQAPGGGLAVADGGQANTHVTLTNSLVPAAARRGLRHRRL